MKSLKVIQVFAKIASVVSLIVFICAIVGAAGCVTGILGIGIPAKMVWDGKTVQEIIETQTKLKYGDLYGAMLAGGIVCSYLIYLGWESKKYFDLELEDGTPFTKRGAVEIRNLGIKTLAASISGTILAGIACGIAQETMGKTQEIRLDNGGSFVIGIVFIVLSFIFSYGASLREKEESK